MDTNEIVYVLANSAMPDIVKIGNTTQADIKTRMNQLYTTGVPVPFECVFVKSGTVYSFINLVWITKEKSTL